VQPSASQKLTKKRLKRFWLGVELIIILLPEDS